MEAEYQILEYLADTPSDALTGLEKNVNERMFDGYYPVGGPQVFHEPSTILRVGGWHAIQSVLRERQS